MANEMWCVYEKFVTWYTGAATSLCELNNLELNEVVFENCAPIESFLLITSHYMLDCGQSNLQHYLEQIFACRSIIEFFFEQVSLNQVNYGVSDRQ